MLKLLHRNEINIQKWDALIKNSSKSYIYGYSWYLDAVCTNWKGIVLDDYKAILPVPTKSFLFFEICYQPFFHQNLEIISLNQISDKQILSFFYLLNSKYKIQLFRTHVKLPHATTWNYQMLDLTQDIENIDSNYSSNVKRMIKKSTKHKVKVIEHKNVNEFVLFFKNQIGKKLNFDRGNYSKLSNLISEVFNRKKGIILSVIDEYNQRLASGVFFIEKNKVIYLKGATNDKGKKLGAMHFLMNFAIKKFKFSHNYFDFGGSNVKSISEFYKRFGALDYSYFSVDIVQGKLLNKIIKWKRKN